MKNKRFQLWGTCATRCLISLPVSTAQELPSPVGIVHCAENVLLLLSLCLNALLFFRLRRKRGWPLR